MPVPIRQCLHIRGRVQGVGFRWFAQRVARELDVTGWVANRPDGSVQCEVQGEPQAVAAFVARVRRGPPHACVTEVVVDDLAPRADAMTFAIEP